MDRRKFNGGHKTKNAGRKKDSGLSGAIKKHVDRMLSEMLKDEHIQKQIHNDLVQLSFTTGWIYIIKDLDKDLYKVGVTQSKNPNSRLSLYTSHDMNIELIYIENIEDCYSIEDHLHELIIDLRVKGDWFKLTSNEIMLLIRTICENKYKKIFDARRTQKQ